MDTCIVDFTGLETRDGHKPVGPIGMKARGGQSNFVTYWFVDPNL